jgi:hypothetical protein
VGREGEDRSASSPSEWYPLSLVFGEFAKRVQRRETTERKYGVYYPEILRSANGVCRCTLRRPLWAIGESYRLFYADKQHGAPPDPQTIRKLASQIVGQVITPDAADYDAARSIFNRAFDRRPAVIVRCGSPSDVARALDFTQAQHLPLAVRAGGHSRLGFGMCDGGVVIDLSAMRRVEVDISKRVARRGWRSRA